MKQQSGDEVELRRYLLGELSQEAQVSVEARLFLDSEYLLELKAAEDELIDDYVYDDLPLEVREKLETHFLSSPERQDDVRIARALKKYISSETASVAPPAADIADDLAVPADSKLPPRSGTGQSSLLSFPFKRRPVASFLLAAAAVLILSLMIWMGVQSLRRQGGTDPILSRETPAQNQPNERRQDEPADDAQANGNRGGEGNGTAERQDNSPKGAGREANQRDDRAGRQTGRGRKPSPPAPPSTQVMAFLLTPGGPVREGGTANEIPAPAAGGSVVLQLPLVGKDNYRSYRATLNTGGRVIRTWVDLKSTDSEVGKVVPLKVPARFLREQSYQIKLAGVDAGGRVSNIASYAFRVKEK